MGYPIHQWIYAEDLEKAGQLEEALQWYKRGAEGGQLECWFHIGKAYEEGKGAPKDPTYAASCYEKGLTQKQDSGKRVGCANRNAYYMLGYIYGRGLGVPADIKKGVEYLQKAGNHKEAKEELLNYKKKLFGGWVRR